MLRPGRKHKFRINYLPMTYSAQSRPCIASSSSTASDTTSTCRYDRAVVEDMASSATSTTFSTAIGGSSGFVLQAKATDIQATLQAASIGTEFARAQAPIPTLGGIGRVYVVPNISITGELDRLQDSDSIDERYQAHYFDFDLYGTVNFNDYVGAQIGYRSLDLGYIFEDDHGDFKAKGMYFGGVVRYDSQRRARMRDLGFFRFRLALPVTRAASFASRLSASSSVSSFLL